MLVYVSIQYYSYYILPYKKISVKKAAFIAKDASKNPLRHKQEHGALCSIPLENLRVLTL